MGSKFTKLDLERVTDYIQFEFFSNDLMSRQGYRDIEPMGGHKDKGRDAIYRDKSTGEDIIFTYSVREDWNIKLDEDIKKIKKHKHPCDRVVFLTTSSPTATEKDSKKKEVKDKYGWELEIFDIERIATLVDNHYQDLRQLHPDIFFFTTRLPEFESVEKELNKKEYAQYLLASHEEWLEKYTPLLAEHREIDTYVARIRLGRVPGHEIPVQEIPEASHVSVLLGESGSGKTTALWRILVETAKAILEGKTQKLPILLSLRGWSTNHTCRDLVQDQFDILDVSRDRVEEELWQGNCLILIDGLNELPLGNQTEAYQDLARFLSKYQNNTFVICCRATDYETRMLNPEGLSGKVGHPEAYEIRRMGRQQMIDYVRKYFKEDTNSADELLSKLGVFTDGIWEDQKSIVHLARIPLYLQLFISEYKRSGKLPSNQARLLQALIDTTLEREKAKQAAKVDSFAKQRLLSSFAYEAVGEGYTLRLPEYVALEIFKKKVQELKEQSLIHADLTVGAVWQEVISNNFLKAVDRLWIEWLHQLILDYFLAGEIVHIWTVGTDNDRGNLRAGLSRYTWAQPCAIALGLLDYKTGARFLDLLMQIDDVLAQRAFESQTEEDQKELSEALVSDIIEERDTDTSRLKMLAMNLPSRVIVQTLIDKFDVCSKEMEAPIAEAISSLMMAHSVRIVWRNQHGYVDYSIDAQRYEALSSAVRRATDVLVAWTQNRNELVSFHAAKGLWESEKGLAADTLRRLLTASSNPEIRRLVKDLMDEWNIDSGADII